MKKLSLLLALALFGWGSATIVNAEMETSETPEGTTEEVVLDEDGNPIIPTPDEGETAQDSTPEAE